jgi:hypothetical protein
MATGVYIVEADVDNWRADQNDSDRQSVINFVEEWLETLTKDTFREKPFDIFRDGNGKDYLDLGIRGNILSISAIYLLDVAMNTSTYTWNSHVIHRDDSGIASDDYLQWLRNTKTRISEGFFPEGHGNLEIVGTMGRPQKLSFDNLSGTFRARETITGATNSYTARVIRVESSYLHIAGKSGNYADDEQITGGDSSATADVNSASGAIDDPPLGVKEACIMMARWKNDNTLYTQYMEGSESVDGVSYSSKRKPLTGLREIDDILREYVRKRPRVAVL